MGVIDLGSNSTRMLVAKPEGEVVCRQERVTGLVQKMGTGEGKISEAAMARTLAVLSEYRHELDRYGITPIVVSTAAARRALNRTTFFAQIEDLLGVYPRLLSAGEEASFAFWGATRGISLAPEQLLVVDIGGGSTELAWLDNKQKPIEYISLELGSVSVSESWLSPPISPLRWQETLSLISQSIAVTSAGVAGREMVGIAGTWVTLASLIGDRCTSPAIGEEGLSATCPSVSLIELETLADRLRPLSVAEIGKLEGIADRAPVIRGGLAVAIAVMGATAHESAYVVNTDLMDGIVRSMFN